MIVVLVVLFLVVWALSRAARAMEMPPRLTSRNVIPLSVFPQSPSHLMAEARRYAPRPVVRPVAIAPAVVAPQAVVRKFDLEPESVAVAAMEAPPVYFKVGEPTSFEELDAQPAVVADLRDAIAAMLADGKQAIDPQMFLGPPGMGKTLFAKTTAAEISKALGRPVEFYETFPADLPDVAKLDAVIRRAHEHPGCVLFIDEAHDLGGSLSLKLYLVLEEGRYQFANDPFPTKLAPFTLLAATTDSGLLHAALKRRWINHHFVRASREQLLGYVTRRGFKITKEAADLIVSRTHWSGAPWEALQLYTLATKRAKARGSFQVSLADAGDIVERHKLDELGLNELDRSVLMALLQPSAERGRMVKGVWTRTHYALSEDDLCNAVGIDKGAYRTEVKRKLIARGLLTTRGGQALTPKAVELYRSAA